MCSCPAARGAVCAQTLWCGTNSCGDQYGMDDEDLALLRAQGVKSVKDFSRIKDLMELNLPPGFGRPDLLYVCPPRRCPRMVDAIGGDACVAFPRTARMRMQ